MNKPAHPSDKNNTTPNEDTDSTPTDAFEAMPMAVRLGTHFPRQICVDALAYNWTELNDDWCVELSVLTDRNAPIEFPEPLAVIGCHRSIQAPPIEGLLVHAVLLQRKPEQSFVLSQAFQAQGPVYGVSSQPYRVPDWSQMAMDHLIENLAKSGMSLAELRRVLLQINIEQPWGLIDGVLQPTGRPWSSFKAGLRSHRPHSWKALRDATPSGPRTKRTTHDAFQEAQEATVSPRTDPSLDTDVDGEVNGNSA